MKPGHPHFELQAEFAEYLAQTGVVKTPDDYFWWMNRIGEYLGRRIGPAELSGEADVQSLLSEVRALDAKNPQGRLLTNPGSANNLQSILRKYAKMVQSRFASGAADRSALEAKLDAAMRTTYERTGQETGYWARRFLVALNRKGALAYAKQLLRPTQKEVATPGLQTLIDAGRTDLSFERIVLRPELAPLFTEAELAEATRRLDMLPAYTKRRDTPAGEQFPDEIVPDDEFVEGAKKKVTVNAYERNNAARDACLAKHGHRCSVCEMSFEEVYGEIGIGFIHVHHKKPLAARRGEYKLNPTTDLAPVCPNCHAMLHRKTPPLGIDELKALLQETGKPQERQQHEDEL